jgi:hypothetical protein
MSMAHQFVCCVAHCRGVDGSYAVTCEFDVGWMFDGDEVVAGPTEINDPDEMVGL